MRGYWRTLAYMAENKNGFRDKIDRASNFVSRGDADDNIQPAILNPGTSAFFLSRQPTKPILTGVDEAIQAADPTLILSAYELGEINRVAYTGKVQDPPHGSLERYWKGLGEVATTNRGNQKFMEAVGALAVDELLRDKLRDGAVLQKFFGVTKEQEDGLRDALREGSQAEVAAQEYFGETWPHGQQCLTRAVVWEKQFHPNI